MITSNSQFIVYSPNVNLSEKKSALNNDIQEVVTYQDIIDNANITSQSISANGFIVTSPIVGTIALPSDSSVQYNGPLSIANGSRVIVPDSTILTIL